MKQAKIAIIVVCLLVGGYLAFKAITSGGARLDDQIEMVDIVSGEIVRAKREDTPGFPALNKDRKQLLLPIERRDGKIYIRSGQENLVAQIVQRDGLSPDDIAVDLESYEVRAK